MPETFRKSIVAVCGVRYDGCCTEHPGAINTRMPLANVTGRSHEMHKTYHSTPATRRFADGR